MLAMFGFDLFLYLFGFIVCLLRCLCFYRVIVASHDWFAFAWNCLVLVRGYSRNGGCFHAFACWVVCSLAVVGLLLRDGVGLVWVLVCHRGGGVGWFCGLCVIFLVELIVIIYLQEGLIGFWVPC